MATFASRSCYCPLRWVNRVPRGHNPVRLWRFRVGFVVFLWLIYACARNNILHKAHFRDENLEISGSSTRRVLRRVFFCWARLRSSVCDFGPAVQFGTIGSTGDSRGHETASPDPSFVASRLFFVAGTIPALAQQTVVPVAEKPSVDPAKLRELIDVLRDDNAREAFLNELQKVARGADEGVEDTAPVPGNLLGARAADVTRRFAEHAVTSAAVFAARLASAPATPSNLSGARLPAQSGLRFDRDLAGNDASDAP